MSNLDKIIEAINLPKRIVDGAELFLKKLLGPTISETGELIADQIRYRRFRNQVIIFTKAKELLLKNHLEPNSINLKTLSPLLEFSSLEEEEDLQNIWANVIANISSYDTEQAINLKCIEVLKSITPNEIILLDRFFEEFQHNEEETIERWKESEWFTKRTSVFPDNTIFAYWDFKEKLSMTQEQLDLYVDRLISYGILKYENPELKESTNNASIEDYFTGSSQPIEVKSYELETSERVHFTNFGLYFVKLCKYENPN